MTHGLTCIFPRGFFTVLKKKKRKERKKKKRKKKEKKRKRKEKKRKNKQTKYRKIFHLHQALKDFVNGSSFIYGSEYTCRPIPMDIII